VTGKPSRGPTEAPAGPQITVDVAGEPAGAGVSDLAGDRAWQRLWIIAQRRPWRSLAIIPSSAGIPTRSVAEVLAAVGKEHLGRPVLVIDATSLPLNQLEETRAAIAAHVERNQCVLLALSPVAESATSLALAQSADAALLAIALGETAIREAERAIEEVGAARFLGSFVINPRDPRR
jgi:hypothetical protein